MSVGASSRVKSIAGFSTRVLPFFPPHSPIFLLLEATSPRVQRQPTTFITDTSGAGLIMDFQPVLTFTRISVTVIARWPYTCCCIHTCVIRAGCERDQFGIIMPLFAISFPKCAPRVHRGWRFTSADVATASTIARSSLYGNEKPTTERRKIKSDEKCAIYHVFREINFRLFSIWLIFSPLDRSCIVGHLCAIIIKIKNELQMVWIVENWNKSRESCAEY